MRVYAPVTAGLTALLGSGFDPGVTQAYCAYAAKHEFDTIDTIDILDCNGGDHGYPFATNFNPEINLREVSAPGSYWENGHLHPCRENQKILHTLATYGIVGLRRIEEEYKKK